MTPTKLIPVVIAVCLLAELRAVGQSQNDRAPDEIGPNKKVWHAPMTRPWQGIQAGSVQPTSNLPMGNVVQLETGMHYWDGARWAPSDPSFDASDEVFVATRVQHRISVAANLNQDAAVRVMTPDGINLSSTPVAIALLDPVSNRFEVIAQISDCTATLISSNQILFLNAFAGGVCADVLYTLKKGSFEQDVVITSRLDPVAFGFPKNSRIQVITEFYEAPAPRRLRRPLYVERDQRVRNQKASPDLIDEMLGFGQFVIGSGRAFTGAPFARTNGAQALVAKEFATVGSRKFLFETVDSPAIRAGLLALPPCQVPSGGEAALKRFNGKAEGYASIPKPRATSKVLSELKPASPELVAKGEKRIGVIIDYLATFGNETTVLRGDTTYHVVGQVYCNGALTINGGAVVKYNEGASIVVNGYLLDCRASSYAPSFFTGVDDDSIGVTLTGYPGYSGLLGSGYGNPALQIPYIQEPVLKNLRFSYAAVGVQFEGNVNARIEHSQFFKCIRGIVLSGGDESGSGGSGSGATGRVEVFNSLLHKVETILTVTGMAEEFGGTGPGKFRFCTIDGGKLIDADNAYYGDYALEYCIISNLGQMGSGYKAGYGNAFFVSDKQGYSGSSDLPDLAQSPFQVVGEGRHYLKENSPCTRTVAINEPEIALRTTRAPFLLSGPITRDTLLSRILPITAGPDDPGYHYDRLDYLLHNIPLSASLTLMPGVAVGVSGSNGLSMLPGSHVSSIGNPTAYNRICHIANVHGTTTNKSTAPLMGMGCPANSRMDFRFTDFSMPPGGPFASTDASSAVLRVPYGSTPSGELSIRDCILRGGVMYLSPGSTGTDLSVSITNSVFECVTLTFVRQPYAQHTLNSYNNLFRDCRLYLTYAGEVGPAWRFHDNLFDNTFQSALGPPGAIVASHNGFGNGSLNSLGGSANKTGLTLEYLHGPLGGFYYPVNGASTTLTALINAGSRSPADAGLFHYTVKAAANTKEGLDSGPPFAVDIGYHFVGVNSIGVPMDSDADGFADHFEDVNGTGDPETSDWTSYNSQNGLTEQSGLEVFKPLE